MAMSRSAEMLKGALLRRGWLCSLASGFTVKGGPPSVPGGAMAVRRAGVAAQILPAAAAAAPVNVSWRDLEGCTSPFSLACRLRGPLSGLRSFMTTPSVLMSEATAAAAAAAPAVVEGAPVASEGSTEAGSSRAKSVKDRALRHKASHHSFPRAHARAYKLPTSVKKLNLVARLVRLARVDAAILQLSLQPQKAARMIRKLIHEAKFNAGAMGMNMENLVVDEVIVGRGPFLKRLEFKGRGKTGVIRRPCCNLYVYVREVQETDEIKFHHVKRKRPRWKCGRLKK